MTYMDEIRTYSPLDDQEKSDQAVMLSLIEQYPDLVLTRDLPFAHVTSSGFIINQTGDKMLMIFHNIYRSWGWTGGHCDGDSNLLDVAIREAKEETGIKNVDPLFPGIASIDILPVPAHYKRGRYVSVHLHLSIAYVLVASEEDAVQMKPDENSGVQWIPTTELTQYCNEEVMIPVYQKLIHKAQEFINAKR